MQYVIWFIMTSILCFFTYRFAKARKDKRDAEAFREPIPLDYDKPSTDPKPPMEDLYVPEPTDGDSDMPDIADV